MHGRGTQQVLTQGWRDGSGPPLRKDNLTRARREARMWVAPCTGILFCTHSLMLLPEQLLDLSMTGVGWERGISLYSPVLRSSAATHPGQPHPDGSPDLFFKHPGFISSRKSTRMPEAPAVVCCLAQSRRSSLESPGKYLLSAYCVAGPDASFGETAVNTHVPVFARQLGRQQTSHGGNSEIKPSTGLG